MTPPWSADPAVRDAQDALEAFVSAEGFDPAMHSTLLEGWQTHLTALCAAVYAVGREPQGEWIRRFMDFGEHSESCMASGEMNCTCGLTNLYFEAEAIVGERLHIEELATPPSPPSPPGAPERESHRIAAIICREQGAENLAHALIIADAILSAGYRRTEEAK